MKMSKFINQLMKFPLRLWRILVRTPAIIRVVYRKTFRPAYRALYSMYWRMNEKFNVIKPSWIEKLDHDEIRKEIAGFSKSPLISIIMPVCDTNTKFLDAAIQSVREQLYENWELCLVDDASKKQETVAYLKSINHPRIKIKINENGKGISGASNDALAMANGEFVAFLDHDDLITPNSLFEMMKIVNEKETDFIYSDEDIINSNHAFYNPFFKPDFCPDLLLCHNYITHLCMIRKTLVDRVGGFDPRFDGAQDYDLFLKVTELTDKISHIPKVLYHWRSTGASTSTNPSAKMYANEAGKMALREAVKRREIEATVIYGKLPFHYQVRRKLLDTPLVSIIIPFKDHSMLLERCIEAILYKSSYQNFEIIGVSNNSEEQQTFEMMERLSSMDTRVQFHRYDVPFNYSQINNQAVFQWAKGEHILMLNNDVEIINCDWLEALLSHSQRPEVGAVGGKLYYPDYTIQHAGVILGLGGDPERRVAGHSHKGITGQNIGYFFRPQSTQNVSAVTGACLMIKKCLYEELGGLNEANLGIAFNDVDFCLRLREKGLLNVYTPFCEAWHYESSSRGYEDTPEKLERFEREIDYMLERHQITLKNGDPYYNKNLTHSKENFTYEW